MGILTFLDLDDTVFQTRRKCPGGAPLVVATVSRDGSPLSFMTEAQRTLVDWLVRTTTVIPTTGRCHDALRRVQIPFEHGAIVDHGGAIVGPGGELDRAWDERVAAILARSHHAIVRARETLDALEVREALGLRVRTVTDFGRDIYVVAKHASADPGALATARAACDDLVSREPALRLVATDNNLALLPREIRKEAAVRHVRERLAKKTLLTLGVGDSLADLAYMLDCHFAMLPSRSQIVSEALRAER